MEEYQGHSARGMHHRSGRLGLGSDADEGENESTVDQEALESDVGSL